MENYTHCPKCDVQLIYKPSINICPNCGWDSEEESEEQEPDCDPNSHLDNDYERDDRDSCSHCGDYHSMSGPCPNDPDDDLPF